MCKVKMQHSKNKASAPHHVMQLGRVLRLDRLAPINYRKEVIKGIRWVPQLDGGALLCWAVMSGDWTGSERPLLGQVLHRSGWQPGRCRVTEMEVNFNLHKTSIRGEIISWEEIKET